jgi:hypothetical protein
MSSSSYRQQQSDVPNNELVPGSLILRHNAASSPFAAVKSLPDSEKTHLRSSSFTSSVKRALFSHDAKYSEMLGKVRMSDTGQSIYWSSTHTLVLFSIVLASLTLAQSVSVYMTLRMVQVLMWMYHVMSCICVGMDWKMQERITDSRRADLRSFCFGFNYLVTLLIVVHLQYAIHLSPSSKLNQTADDFRTSGINKFLPRTLDTVYMMTTFGGAFMIALLLSEIVYFMKRRKHTGKIGTSTNAKETDDGQETRLLAPIESEDEHD